VNVYVNAYLALGSSGNNKAQRAIKTENNILLRLCQIGPAHKQNGIILKKNLSLSLSERRRVRETEHLKKKKNDTTNDTIKKNERKKQMYIGRDSKV
jgi:hypothetical protein